MRERPSYVLLAPLLKRQQPLFKGVGEEEFAVFGIATLVGPQHDLDKAVLTINVDHLAAAECLVEHRGAWLERGELRIRHRGRLMPVELGFLGIARKPSSGTACRGLAAAEGELEARAALCELVHRSIEFSAADHPEVVSAGTA